MERLIEQGTLKIKSSDQINHSRIGIGFEKLDRDVFDPRKAYDKLAETGVKWARIQSGWQRTEKTPGVYDFSWLDSIVDNLLSRGIQPWICLCYGNELYSEAAKTVFGAVGIPPIKTPEERKAWFDYVYATAKHFEGRVSLYEIWNEPDGIWCWKHGVNATEYGQFAIETAKAVKKASASNEVVGCAICLQSNAFFAEALKTGMADYIDHISFHEYTTDETTVCSRVSTFRGILNNIKPDIKIIQGESGSQSRSDGQGALKGASWTQLKQAKQLLRHTVMDLSTEVVFTSYFTAVDMIEALNGVVGSKSSYLDYGYFGILSASFDENGFSIGEYDRKLSHTALSSLCTLFGEDFETIDFPAAFLPCHSNRLLANESILPTYVKKGFKRSNGSFALAYWNSSNLLTETYEATITIEVVGLEGDIRLVDPMTGKVYSFPESMLEKNEFGVVTIKNAPILDYPLVITFGDFSL